MCPVYTGWRGTPSPVFLKLHILKGFKSFVLKMRILKGLQLDSCKCSF
jgi:hypothetical protein